LRARLRERLTQSAGDQTSRRREVLSFGHHAEVAPSTKVATLGVPIAATSALEMIGDAGDAHQAFASGVPFGQLLDLISD
jgi:hypothetical protein